MEIAVVADVHIGHQAALWPEDFKDELGNGKTLSEPQKLLLEYWKDYWTSEEVINAEYVINLAESIEGNNRKEYGRSLVEADLGIQRDAFVYLLEPYIQGKKYLGLSGSAYHTSLDYDVEKSICQRLNGQYFNTIANIQFNTDHIIWATHKAGNAMLYKATMLDRNSLYCSAVKTKLPEDPDLLLYAHHHQFFETGTATRKSIICPTWKFWHPIKGADKFFYTQPTIGGIVLRLTKGKEIEIIKKFYPLAHIYSALTEIN